MAFHAANKTTSRDLDRNSDLIMSWIDFWKTFEEINTGSFNFLSLRGEFERIEDDGKRPPWKQLRPLIKASLKESA